MAEVPTKVAVMAPVEAQVAVSVETQVGDGRGQIPRKSSTSLLEMKV